MNTAKSCVWPLSSCWIMTALVVGITFLESGCAGLSGLRSMAPDRTSIFDFRDAPEVGSPTPGTDHYAANLHAGRERAGIEPKSVEGPLLAHQSPLDPLEPVSSSADLAARTGQSEHETDAETAPDAAKAGRLYVTLGRPEPLPALALEAQNRKLASAASSRSWVPEGAPAPSSPVSEPQTALPNESRELALAAPESVKNVPERPKASESAAILARAEAKLRSLKSYNVKVSRMERVGGQLQPQEEISLSVRTQPKAVRLEWSEGASKGREVIYSTALDPKMLYVHAATSAIPLPAMKVAIDSPLVTKNSRHSITEAGLDTIIENLRKAERQDSGRSQNHDELEYQGLQKPPGLDRLCNKFEIRAASGDIYQIFLDSSSSLPCMVIGKDSRGELIERYVYHDITPNPSDLSIADAFEPDKRWGDSKGLLSRLARAATGSELPANSQTRTR